MSDLRVSHRASEMYLTHHRWHHSDMYMFSLRMALLHSDEHELCAGRFHLFARKMQAVPVTLRRVLPGEAETHALIGSMLDWIEENVDHPWSFDVQSHSVHECTLHFTFADDQNAVHFALRWL